MLPLLLALSLAAAPPAQPRVNLDLVDADLRGVLRLLADVGHANFVLDEAVQGTVTVQLHDVAWEDALNAILLSHGLVAVPVGEVRLVRPLGG